MYQTAPNTSIIAHTTVLSATAIDINSKCRSSSSSEDEEILKPTKQIKKKKHKNNQSLTTNEDGPRKLELKDPGE